MARTLADLVTNPTRDQITAQLLGSLNAAAFPVVDFNPGSVGLTLVQMVSAGIVDLSDLVAAVARGGFTTEAAGGWMDLLAEQIYGLSRAPATYTKQRCTVTCAVGAGSGTLKQGQIARAPLIGNRYVYQGADLLVPEGSPQTVEFMAESPGAKYADGPNTITEFVNGTPGLSVTNAQPAVGGLDSSDKAKRGAANAGTGTIAPVGSSQSRTYKATVTTSGAIGAGALQIQYYYQQTTNGVTETLSKTVTVTPIPASYNGSGDPNWDASLTLTFAAGSGSPPFVAGDTHTWSTPGAPITLQGADAETDAALAARCQSRWPSLSLNAVADKWTLWVQQCSIDNALGITKIAATPSTTVPGQVDVTLATASGAPPGGTVTTVQTYLTARSSIGDRPNAQAAANKELTPAGTVIVRLSRLAEIQGSAQLAWQAYLAGLPIGGDRATGSPGVARSDQLMAILVNAGAIEVTGLTLNGGDTVALTSSEVAIDSQALSASLTWQTVA